MGKTVGLIGVGLLGTAMARRWLESGRLVVGWDVEPGRQDALRDLGAAAVHSAAEVLRRTDLLALSLPDSRVVARVLEELAPHLEPGLVVVDTTTGDPRDSTAAAQTLAARGVAYVDATVAGSSAQVLSGEVTVMAGGEASAVERARELTSCFAQHFFHVGPAGSGARMKLVVNLVLGLNRAALAESLHLAQSLGLDEAAALEVLRHTAAYSKVMDVKGAKMVRRDFVPQAKLSQHLKDVRLMLELARRHRTQLPLSQLHEQLLEKVQSAGLGESDNSAIRHAFRDGG